MEVTILGCGSATPTPRHQPSSQVVEHHGRLFMVDCGEGAQSGFRRAGLKKNRLRHIFISHLHGDHLFGLPGMLSTMDLLDGGGVVTIHIHPRGLELVKPWTDYFLKGSGLSVRFRVIEPGQRDVLYEDDSLLVKTFPLNHRMACNGFLFEEKPGSRHLDGAAADFHGVPLWQRQAIKAGADFVKPDGTVIANDRLTTPPDAPRSYAYCSDTMPARRVADAVSGCSLLYHEATYDNSRAAQADKWGHSTAGQAAEVARQAGAGRLMIGHFSQRYENEDLLLAQAREVFPNTILAREGLKVTV